MSSGTTEKSMVTTEGFSLETLQQARKDIKTAELQYLLAIKYAVGDGYSNVKIARVLGISETAVRRYRKRHGI